VTDENRKRRSDPGDPEICNIYTIHKGFSSQEQLEYVKTGCKTAGIGCIDCKKILNENMRRELNPIREKSKKLIEDKDYLYDVLKTGAKRCNAIAKEPMDLVHEKLGISVVR
ncbi:MAG: tryptophan--tRNA ligase, partial [Candidatus Anammoxibacter sp.]